MQPMTSEPTKPKPRRRFWQYSLRTFFVLVTVACGLAWLGQKAYRAWDQWMEVAWVSEMGGSVGLDYKPGVMWRAQDVTFVDLTGTQVSDLTSLARLKKLDLLNLSNTPVKNLTPLAGSKNLRLLYLLNTPVSEDQVKKLRQALPKCQIVWSPPDPSP